MFHFHKALVPSLNGIIKLVLGMELITSEAIALAVAMVNLLVLKKIDFIFLFLFILLEGLKYKINS